MTIEVCNHVHVRRGQCMLSPHHEGDHYYRNDMDTARSFTREKANETALAIKKVTLAFRDAGFPLFDMASLILKALKEVEW